MATHLMADLTTKASVYSLYQKGAFGNKLQTWDSVGEWERSGYSGLVVLRYKQVESPWTRYGLAPGEVIPYVEWCHRQGADEALFTMNELAPDHELALQGEVMRGVGGLQLFASTQPSPMRQALKEAGFNCGGFLAWGWLQRELWPSSYADLEVLLERYPDAVVEFGAYHTAVGCIPGRNTIIWEVREY